MDNKNKWLLATPDINDSFRVFCFSYAGGGASVFRNWLSFFENRAQIYPVQLPGRENRICEKPYDNMNELVKDLSEDLKCFLDKPFILFGHSIGAKIAFEFARKLRNEYGIEPKCLVVSGSRAPEYPEPRPLHILNDENFIKELKRFSGTPKAVLENKELMDFFLPLLRADFTLDETWKYEEDKSFDFPIYAFGGTKDDEADYKEILDWSNHTSAQFDIFMIKGGHFFINENEDKVLGLMDEIIKKYKKETIDVCS